MNRIITSLGFIAIVLMCYSFSCNKSDDSNVTPAPIAALKVNTNTLMQNGGKWSVYALHWNYYKADGTLDFSNGQDKYDATNYTWVSGSDPSLTFAANGTYVMMDRTFFSDILPVENGNWTLSADSWKNH